MSDVLQATKLDLSSAADLLSATTDTLKEFRSDAEWMKVFSYCESVAKLHNIATSPPLTSRRNRTAPSRMSDFVILESTGTRNLSTNATVADSYKVDLYFPVLDCLITEFQTRFSDKNKSLLRALHACNSESSTFLDAAALEPLTTTYDFDADTIALETQLAHRVLKNSEPLEKTNEVILKLLPLKDAFPTLISLLRLSLTISVTTASCERTFSALKKVKSYLRSTMSEDRLVSLAILSLERDISLNLEEVVTAFSSKHKGHRIQLK